ncbi:MAG: hypothetical protein IIW03_06130 [Clostridia bacterium]|nr:hypothetical protein [Clostridia bacterium]
MAKIGFRSSIFGFNKDDVNLYLLQLKQEYSDKETAYKLKQAKLESELTALKEKLDQMGEKLQKAETELEYFKSKEEEIEKMSISIGTMYLMAKQNADQMILSAEQCAKEINEFSARQLDAAAKAGEQLKEIKASVESSTGRFADEIKVLTADLNDSKERLEARLNSAAPRAEITMTVQSDENE